ncbi:MAG: hypothetical protein MZV63_66945 [Marinilabiliales bacterium]|nr:hypothetical protein [Marinilabiliales bacterium]
MGREALLSEERNGLRSWATLFPYFSAMAAISLFFRSFPVARGVSLYEDLILNAMIDNLFLRVSDVELYLVYHRPDARVLKYGVDITLH